MAARLEDYAIIGDCETAALVARDGSIDWLCWPRFDSGAYFAALLGSSDNGRWLIAAADTQARISQRYRGDTLILETLFETASGAATVTDFMPLRGACPCLVRLVEGKRGRLAMRTEYVIRFDYGGELPWVTRLDDGTLCAVAGPDMSVLRTPVVLRGVRCGNAAVKQLQIDVYGELMDVLYHGRHTELGGIREGWDLQRGLLDQLETV